MGTRHEGKLVYDASRHIWIYDIERLEQLVGYAVKNLYSEFLSDLRKGTPPGEILENIWTHFSETEFLDTKSFKFGVLVAILVTAMYVYSNEKVREMAV